MNGLSPWYQRKSTATLAICVFVLLLAVWFWRDWVGLGLETQVQTDASNGFRWALSTSAAEATSFEKVTSGNQTFYLPDYDSQSSAGIYNVQNLKSLFVYYLNQRASMPMFRVESVEIVPTTTMQYIVRIRYATWLGMSKTVTVSGNPPVPHEKK